MLSWNICNPNGYDLLELEHDIGFPLPSVYICLNRPGQIRSSLSNCKCIRRISVGCELSSALWSLDGSVRLIYSLFQIQALNFHLSIENYKKILKHTLVCLTIIQLFFKFSQEPIFSQDQSSVDQFNTASRCTNHWKSEHLSSATKPELASCREILNLMEKYKTIQLVFITSMTLHITPLHCLVDCILTAL